MVPVPSAPDVRPISPSLPLAYLIAVEARTAGKEGIVSFNIKAITTWAGSTIDTSEAVMHGSQIQARRTKNKNTAAYIHWARKGRLFPSLLRAALIWSTCASISSSERRACGLIVRINEYNTY